MAVQLQKVGERHLTGFSRKRCLFMLGASLLAPLLAISHPALGVTTGDIVATESLNDITMLNPYTRHWGDVAWDPVGNTIAVWIGEVPSSPNYTLAGVRRYPSLEGVAPGFYISQTPVAPYTPPSVKADASNRFVAAWAGMDEDGKNVYFRCYEADVSSTPRIDQTRANDILEGDQSFPSIAMNADGSFTLLWQHAPAANGAYTTIYARDYTADCAPAAASYQAYTAPEGASITAMAADGDSAGDAVLAWLEGDGQGTWEVKTQRLGAPQIPAFTVASGAIVADGTAVSVTTAQAADGDFVVSWIAQEEASRALYARRYHADGTAISAEPTLVHTDPYLWRVATSMDALARFGVGFTTESLYESPYTYLAYVRQYDAQMTALYDLKTLRHNDFNFWSLAIATDADGDLLAAWTDSTGSAFSSARVAGPEPVDVSVAVENNPDRTNMERLELTVSVTNNHSVNPEGGVGQGIGASSGLAVQVTPPDGSTKVAMGHGDWTCDTSLLCTLKKPLGAGMTDQFNIYFYNASLGTASTSVTVNSHHADPELTNNEATVDTKVCNDYGAIDFDVTDTNIKVAETIGEYSAPIRRTGGTCGRVSARATTLPAFSTFVSWSYSGVAGVDYTDIDEQLVWADGESGTKTVNIPIIDDDDTDGNKQFEVRLAGITSATLGTNSRVIVTIEDDESETASAEDEPTDGSPTNSDTSSSGSGGGGSIDLALLFLCTLPWLARRLRLASGT